ncbi:MAG: radical SAM protein [Candidatus Omnitrophota bacterium]|jgi:radical SAM superfamily enzyme YgiQ (UPF0313 family)
MKPKVLLYNLPPSGGDHFPISLGYIAASLAMHSIESALAEIGAITSRTGQEIANFVIDFKPGVVGFSVYQDNIQLAVQLAELIKMIDPRILVVIGGPQATFMPKEALLQMRAVDVIVRGEGEVIMPSLVDCYSKRRDFQKVKGIAFRKGKLIFDTSPQALIRHLDDFPSPYQTGAFNLAQHKTALMLTSRGCNFNCSFCYTPLAFQRIIRAHTTTRVLQDMRVCVENNINKFFFADPSFTYNKERVRAIANGIIKRGWQVKIWVETRADLVDRALLSLMAKAGVNRIAYGLESVDPQVNAAINKRIDLKRFADVIKATQDAGIDAEVFTLYGLPQQTYASCLKTIQFLKKLRVKLTGNSSGQQLVLFWGADITGNPEKYGIQVLPRKRPLYLSAGQYFRTKYLKRSDMKRVALQYKTAREDNKEENSAECISLF